MPRNRDNKDSDTDFRLIFQASPQPMWVLDSSAGRFLDVNRAACELYGRSRDEFLQLKPSELEAAHENHDAPPPGVRRDRKAGGQIVEVEVSSTRVPFEGRDAELAVLTDVTERRQLEEQLRQAHKMEAVGMLAGGVAHDFNNLLTIIAGYSQLILNNLRPDDPNRHSAEQIMRAGDRAAALTRQLLAFSRRQSMQPRVIELNKLVGGLGVMLQRLIGEDIDLKLRLQPDLGRVSADPGQVEQVLMNLVVNARDAMPQGGKLTVETANVHLDERYAGRHLSIRPGPYVLLAVSDTGHGMDQSTRERLFEPFFTTKGQGKGTGLGLSTVFGIVKQSGGSVEVYSEVGRGTSIKVYLPRIDQPVATEETEASPQKAQRGSETILVVEDEEMVRQLVRETLEREGYKVLHASDPADAQRVLGGFRGKLDLLITDVVMPGSSGRELADKVVANRPEIKVLYMSGYTDAAIVSSGILEKEVAFLQKPFSPATLSQKVREVLENSGDRTRGAGE